MVLPSLAYSRIQRPAQAQIIRTLRIADHALRNSPDQRNELRLPRLQAQVQNSQGDWKVKPLRSGTARIEVNHSISFGLFSLMRVPTNDEIDFCRFRLQIQFPYIVQNIKACAIGLHNGC